MTILIGVHGKPHAGKDTIATGLISKYNLLREGPSRYVKDTTAVMFNVPRDYLDNERMKEVIDPFWKMSYRQMCQKVGKESSRDVFGDDFWLRHVEKTLINIRNGQSLFGFNYQGIILADIRYQNEIEWVKTNGGVVIFVIREDAERGYISGSEHDAEKGLNVQLADIVILNDGTLDDLNKKIDNIKIVQ